MNTIILLNYSLIAFFEHRVHLRTIEKFFLRFFQRKFDSSLAIIELERYLRIFESRSCKIFTFKERFIGINRFRYKNLRSKLIRFFFFWISYYTYYIFLNLYITTLLVNTRTRTDNLQRWNIIYYLKFLICTYQASIALNHKFLLSCNKCSSMISLYNNAIERHIMKLQFINSIV